MLNSMFCRWAGDTWCLVGGDTTGDQISCQSPWLPRCCGVQWEHQHLVCNALLYSAQNTTVCVYCTYFLTLHWWSSEEVCILSASGTAAILNPRYMREGCLDIGIDHRCCIQVTESRVSSVRCCSESWQSLVWRAPGLRSRLHQVVVSVTSPTMSSTCPSPPSSPTVTTAGGKRFSLFSACFFFLGRGGGDFESKW